MFLPMTPGGLDPRKVPLGLAPLALRGSDFSKLRFPTCPICASSPLPATCKHRRALHDSFTMQPSAHCLVPQRMGINLGLDLEFVPRVATVV